MNFDVNLLFIASKLIIINILGEIAIWGWLKMSTEYKNL